MIGLFTVMSLRKNQKITFIVELLHYEAKGRVGNFKYATTDFNTFGFPGSYRHDKCKAKN